jgi:ATP-dependent Clp protease protease subunit
MLITHKTSIRSRSNKRESTIDKASTEATIYLYGDIGGWFGIDHQDWIKEFSAITAEKIHLRVDSSGGDIFAARAMKTCIEQHKAKVIAHVDGLAASAASFMIMGANEIEIVDGGFLMVHKAMSMIDILGYFNEDDLEELCEDMQKEMQLHGKINEAIANDYAKKTKKKKEECLAWMEEETWFTAQEAMDAGLVDRIYEGEPVEGSYDLSIYAKVPDAINSRNQAPSKRAIEKALRDAGLSNKQAKDILMKGYQKDTEDEPHQEDVVPQPGVVNASDPIIPISPVVDHQEDEKPPVKKKDRIADLLVRAEIVAPSK